MQEIVKVPIADRRLWRDRSQRRMGIDHTRRRVEAWIRYSKHPDTSVVVADVLDQPIDRVVRIGALVAIGGRSFVGDMRRDLLKRSFGHESTTDVLVDEDITCLHKMVAGT